MQQGEREKQRKMERKEAEKCNLLFVGGMNSAAGRGLVINANVCGWYGRGLLATDYLQRGVERG